LRIEDAVLNVYGVERYVSSYDDTRGSLTDLTVSDILDYKDELMETLSEENGEPGDIIKKKAWNVEYVGYFVVTVVSIIVICAYLREPFLRFCRHMKGHTAVAQEPEENVTN